MSTRPRLQLAVITRAFPERFLNLFQRSPRTHVTILEGVTDLLQGRRPQDVVAHLRQMAHTAHAAHVVPVLITLLPTGDQRINAEIASVNAGIRQLAHAMNTSLVDAHRAFQSLHPIEALYRQPNCQMDGLHPNDAGYKLLAGVVARDLQATPD